MNVLTILQNSINNFGTKLWNDNRQAQQTYTAFVNDLSHPLGLLQEKLGDQLRAHYISHNQSDGVCRLYTLGEDGRQRTICSLDKYWLSPETYEATQGQSLNAVVNAVRCAIREYDEDFKAITVAENTHPKLTTVTRWPEGTQHCDFGNDNQDEYGINMNKACQRLAKHLVDARQHPTEKTYTFYDLLYQTRLARLDASKADERGTPELYKQDDFFSIGKFLGVTTGVLDEYKMCLEQSPLFKKLINYANNDLCEIKPHKDNNFVLYPEFYDSNYNPYTVATLLNFISNGYKLSADLENKKFYLTRNNDTRTFTMEKDMPFHVLKMEAKGSKDTLSECAQIFAGIFDAQNSQSSFAEVLTLYHKMVHEPVFARGTAATAHAILQTIMASLGVNVPPTKQDKALDLEAFKRPLLAFIHDALKGTFFDQPVLKNLSPDICKQLIMQFSAEKEYQYKSGYLYYVRLYKAEDPIKILREQGMVQDTQNNDSMRKLSLIIGAAIAAATPAQEASTSSGKITLKRR